MKKIVSIIILLTFVPTLCLANGTIVTLNKGDPAPFSGSLLDPTAVANILAEKEKILKDKELEISYLKMKLQLEKEIAIGNLNIKISILEQRLNLMLRIKDDEISRLREIATKNSNDYNQWWAGGGFLIGAACTIALFFAAKEINK